MFVSLLVIRPGRPRNILLLATALPRDPLTSDKTLATNLFVVN